MGLSLDELDPPLDDVAYLSRSNNRVAVLRELAGDAQTRQALRDATGASRPTLSRILHGFEERGWVASSGRGNGHDYSLTPLGRVILEEFTDTVTTFETVQQLREIAPLIPFDELELDPRDLAEARITTPSSTDATAHARREVELLAETDRVQFLCNEAQPETVGRYRDWIVERDGQFEAIIAGDAIDVARADEEMRSYLQDMLAADGVTIYRYEGDVSVMLGLMDEIANIIPLDESGIPRAFIESEDERVRSCVASALDRYRDRADPVSLDDPTH